MLRKQQLAKQTSFLPFLNLAAFKKTETLQKEKGLQKMLRVKQNPRRGGEGGVATWKLEALWG